MEKGEGSISRVGRQRKTPGDHNYQTSVATLTVEGRATLEKVINKKHPTDPTKLAISSTSSTFFDKAFPSYNWLRSGWIVEERRMLSSKRLYRYYYDPAGQTYNTIQEVEYMWKALDRDNPPDNNNRGNHQDNNNRDIIVLDD